MIRSHEDVVVDQFATRADVYVQSTVHAQGEDLDALEVIAAREQPKHALDLGSGGGHVAYRMAAHAHKVTAVDLSAAMTETVARTALAHGLSNIVICVAPAECMPYEDSTFDMLGCRFSAHHWRDFTGGMREARRVLKPGATAIFVDVIAQGHAPFDTHLQAVELLRDPSHVRDYTLGEWSAALTQAGFRVRNTQTRRVRMEFATWLERMRTTEVHGAAIRSLQQSASTEVATYFAIEADGSFWLDVVQIEAVACRARDLGTGRLAASSP
jgi:ubiquinone/menaquinone biosynthesis C-methylase UbiE